MVKILLKNIFGALRTSHFGKWVFVMILRLDKTGDHMIFDGNPVTSKRKLVYYLSGIFVL